MFFPEETSCNSVCFPYLLQITFTSLSKTYPDTKYPTGSINTKTIWDLSE